MNITTATDLLEHFREHVVVLPQTPEDIGQVVHNAFNSGRGAIKPHYQTFDGSESESLKTTLLELAALTKSYYFITLPQDHPYHLDELTLHDLLAQKKYSSMWLNAFRAITPQAQKEIGDWVTQETLFCWNHNGEPFRVFCVTRT